VGETVGLELVELPEEIVVVFVVESVIETGKIMSDSSGVKEGIRNRVR
jgi:hypothetical protein